MDFHVLTIKLMVEDAEQKRLSKRNATLEAEVSLLSVNNLTCFCYLMLVLGTDCQGSYVTSLQNMEYWACIHKVF